MTDYTITVSRQDCPDCGATAVPSYHEDERCQSPVVYADGGWRCSGCNTRIERSHDCPSCGARLRPDRVDVGLALAPTVDPAAVERAVHRRTNAARRDHGLAALEYCDHLAAVALAHSRDMAIQDYFAHESPDGAGTLDRYRRFGHDTDSLSENIALRQPGPTASVEDVARSVVDGLLDSPGHRENILQERHTEEGIGIYAADDGRLYATQNFF